ncbi:carbohydrate ABC transporter permease [Paenibacillus contaminans]|uniref:Carbohydrate ABC transporter permease n=1 Tax=Paenibacillus contaminans TaxID=450362 RepID=A0A329MGV2_9BACL|nr:carbohydrate ABC transporter permease [Paenibacillus contaminans]RAV19181.1 carbohydrate ABC transporter permease [Paenibacillus contaminans]
MSARRIALGLKHVLFGRSERSGLLARLLLYLVLLDVALLYLTPILYMISTMFKNSTDLLDPTVRWIPRALEWENLRMAWEGLRFPKTFANTIVLAGAGAVFQVVSCSIAGYAFARFKFPGRHLLFGLLIFSFLIPPQTVMVPLFALMKESGLLNTKWAILGPDLFGHGIRGSLFVIIFRQFFRTLPFELEDAARIDGAGPFKLFLKVMVPLAVPAIVVVFIFSFIWHWNETYLTGMMVGADNMTLSNSLFKMTEVLKQLAGRTAEVNETVKMAASFLIIFPPLILYAITQRWFIEGVERTGLVD